MDTGKTNSIFSAGEKVRHPKFGRGVIRILKPFEKSFVEFFSGTNGESNENSRCVWVNNSELIKEN